MYNNHIYFMYIHVSINVYLCDVLLKQTAISLIAFATVIRRTTTPQAIWVAVKILLPKISNSTPSNGGNITRLYNIIFQLRYMHRIYKVIYKNIYTYISCAQSLTRFSSSVLQWLRACMTNVFTVNFFLLGKFVSFLNKNIFVKIIKLLFT